MNFLCNECPIIRNWFEWYYYPNKWLVSDFYTESDLQPIWEKELEQMRIPKEDQEKNMQEIMDEIEKDMENMPYEIKQLNNFKKQWADTEKIKQHKRNKELYYRIDIIGERE